LLNGAKNTKRGVILFSASSNVISKHNAGLHNAPWSKFEDVIDQI